MVPVSVFSITTTMMMTMTLIHKMTTTAPATTKGVSHASKTLISVIFAWLWCSLSNDEQTRRIISINVLILKRLIHHNKDLDIDTKKRKSH